MLVRAPRSAGLSRAGFENAVLFPEAPRGTRAERHVSRGTAVRAARGGRAKILTRSRERFINDVEPTGPVASETARHAGATLVRRTVIRTRHAAIQDGVPCRWSAQRYFANWDGLLRIVSESTE